MNWAAIRGDLNGSQAKAFEELCAQIARCETPDGEDFVRVGAPDGGIECYRIRKDGTLSGWQAKYFLTTPGDAQWRQLDESVERALEKRPKLTEYTVCIPQDRADPKIENRHFFMDKWNEAVKRWEAFATTRGVTVRFQYWGASELDGFLAQPKHAGRVELWFGQTTYSANWFKTRVAAAIANVGERYDPKLSVPVATAATFDGLLMRQAFVERFHSAIATARERYSSFLVTIEKYQELKDIAAQLDRDFTNLIQRAEEIAVDQTRPVDQSEINRLAIALCEGSTDCWRALSDRISNSTKDEEQGLRSDSYWIREQRERFSNLRALISGKAFRALASRSLILTGQGGSGKTFLICDIAEDLIAEDVPALLFLGSHFNAGDIFFQLMAQVGANTDRDKFLTAIDSAAEAQQRRALIALDAINESQDLSIWHAQIAGVLKTLSAYPWITLVVSIRSSYIKQLIPDAIAAKTIKVEHDGFSGTLTQAVNHYFDFYKIERPTVPFLMPEFALPLFLQIFCRAISNSATRELPAGVAGITSVFNFFLHSLEEKLCRPDQLDYDVNEKPVQRSVDALVGAMLAADKSFVSRSTAKKLIDEILPPNNGYERSLFARLFAEGLLLKDITYEAETAEDVVRFTYERFSDHALVGGVFARCNENLEAVKSDPMFVKIFSSDLGVLSNQSLAEAFAIQIPERANVELFDVTARRVTEAFLLSLPWRSTASIGDAAKARTTMLLSHSNYDRTATFDALCVLAGFSGHPLGIDYLDAHLKAMSLAERDATWTIFVNENADGTAIERAIKWAYGVSGDVANGTIESVGRLISWFFTSSNRPLRDSALKAAVALYRINPLCAANVHRSFLDVNDVYVLERTLAAVYGASLRSAKPEVIVQIGELIFDLYFAAGKQPPVHVLARDYARGAVEWAVRNGSKIDPVASRPPYKSTWVEPPEITWKRPAGDQERSWGVSAIYSSCGRHGDFSRYVIGTNFSRSPFSSRSLAAGPGERPDDVVEEFVDALNPSQKRYWNRWRDFAAMPRHFFASGNEYRRLKAYDRARASRARSFRKHLNASDRRRFAKDIRPIIGLSRRDYKRFDLKLVERFVFNRCLELGYDERLHGRYDAEISRGGRRTPEIERIGKKYQWCAFYECLARVADNFAYIGDDFTKARDVYSGPWQIRARDIDPSFAYVDLDGFGGLKVEDAYRNFALFARQLHARKPESEDFKRELRDLLSYVDGDGNRWVLLHAELAIEEPIPFGRPRYDGERSDAWLKVRPYVTQKADSTAFSDWAKQSSWWGNDMTGGSSVGDLFFGEVLWHPAFGYFDQPYFGNDDWTSSYRARDSPAPYKMVSMTYFAEASSRDSSHEESYSVPFPRTEMMLDDLQRWCGDTGIFRDNDGTIIGRSIFPAPKLQALIMREDYLKRILDERGYALHLIMLSEARTVDWDGAWNIRGVHRAVYSGSALFGPPLEIEMRFDPVEMARVADDGEDHN